MQTVHNATHRDRAHIQAAGDPTLKPAWETLTLDPKSGLYVAASDPQGFTLDRSTGAYRAVEVKPSPSVPDAADAPEITLQGAAAAGLEIGKAVGLFAGFLLCIPLGVLAGIVQAVCSPPPAAPPTDDGYFFPTKSRPPRRVTETETTIHHRTKTTEH